jgi:hypothetical protein
MKPYNSSIGKKDRKSDKALIQSFFLEVVTLLTMTTVATINRLTTMAERSTLSRPLF